jgi:hypothetical protein
MTVLLSSGWENSGGDDSSDNALWTIVSAPNVVSSPVHSGTYAINIGAQQWLYKESAFGASTYIRFYFMRHTTPVSNVKISAIWDSPSYATPVSLALDTANIVQLTAPSGTYSSGVTLTVDTWYCIEYLRSTGAGNGQAKLWINGTLVVDKTTETMSGNGFELDIGGIVNTDNFEGYFDDVVVADAYIGPATYTLTVNSSPVTGIPFTIV